MTPRGILRVATGAMLMLLVTSSTHAGADSEADALVRRARKVAIDEAYAGFVEVSWRDEAHGEHVERVGARGLGGAFVVGQGDRRVIGHGHERLVDDDGAGVGWTADVERAAPEPGAVWDLRIVGSDTVAGRPATMIEARDDNGRARAVFAIDDERGQLLGRQILDRHGEVVRSVGFVQIVTGAITPAVPPAPDGGAAPPVVIDEVPDGFVAPTTAEGGYRLLGRYRHADGSTHLFYSDGLFTLSVFEQEGAVDWEHLPPGRCQPIHDRRTCAYDTAVGTIVVWNERGLVFTVVGDAPPDLVTAVVDHFDDEPGSDWLTDAVNFVLDPFSWD
jgi:hypothetical protein